MAAMKDDRLLQAVTEAIAGRERDWARQVQRALAGVARALQHHAAAADSPDGLFAEVDLTRPTLTRRVAELRREHGYFLQKVRALQEEVQGIAQAFEPYAEVEGPPHALPEPAVETVSDFGGIRQRVEEFLTALKQHTEAEADLVFETVSTDIGVGD
jgi:hypothetical protein